MHAGQVWTTWWSTSGSGWNTWGTVGDQPFPGGFGADALIAACGRNSGQLDVMVVGPSGEVMAAYWNANEHWSSWGSLGGNFPQGTRLSLVGRQRDRLDLFGIGPSGLYTTWYHLDDGWAEWTRLGPAAWVQGGTPVTVL